MTTQAKIKQPYKYLWEREAIGYIINCSHSLSPNSGQGTVLTMTLVTGPTHPSLIKFKFMASSWRLLLCDSYSDVHLQAGKIWLALPLTLGNTALNIQPGVRRRACEGGSLESTGYAHLYFKTAKTSLVWTGKLSVLCGSPHSYAGSDHRPSSSIPSTHTCLLPPPHTPGALKWWPEKEGNGLAKDSVKITGALYLDRHGSEFHHVI